MNDMIILVTDDEQPARKKLVSFLNEISSNLVIHEAANGIEAVEKISELNPSLVFLDIQMPGMTGFEVIDSIGSGNMPEVVFVTAYDQYALDAFDVNAVDYLLKPFDKNRFKKAFEKAVEKIESKNFKKPDFSKLLSELRRSKSFSDRFLVSHASKYFFVQTEDIIYISSEEKYVSLHTTNGVYLLRETMNNMEDKLNPEKFVRIHRSFIVNILQIKEMQPWSHGDFLVVLKNGEKINMSRRYRGRLMP